MKEGGLAEDDKRLRRDLGLKEVVFFGVGVTLGAGIYAIIGEAALVSGNMVWLSFLVASFVALLSAFSYAELSSRYPDAGGEFEYVNQVFGRSPAFVIGFLVAVTGIVASAAISISFAEYLSVVYPLNRTAAAIGIMLLMAAVNISGIKHSSKTNMIATAITLAGLVLVVLFSIPDLGSVDYLEMPPSGSVGILSAGALIFFAYVGFEDVVKLAEETENPRENIPKGLILSNLIVMVIYLMVSLSLVSVIECEGLGGVEGPLSHLMRSKTGFVGASLMAVFALFATSNSILTNVIATSRIVFDMGRESTILKPLTYLTPGLGTPLTGTLLTSAAILAFILIGDLKTVAALSNMFIFAVFFTINVTAIASRFRPGEEARFKMPLNIGKFPLISVVGAFSILMLFIYNLGNLGFP
ncbi:MAG: amino acid permease [Candidatus Altiarchaeales archaeon]|nr:amino acid permease [Candidatus Altiarchaeales archaeon]MBD3416890.1 amino acid permease [Candidatus Altiarchaeales archaeon]